MPATRKRGRTDTLYPTRLGDRQRDALRLVDDLPGLTVAGLARALDVPLAQAHRVVDRLEARGHLRRRPGVAARAERRP